MAKGKRSRFHVTPRPDGGWQVKREGAKRPSSIHRKKSPAVDRAREMAKSEPLGQVKIHRKDGTIETEHTYGKDPFPPRG